MRKTLLITALYFIFFGTALAQKGDKSLSAGILLSQPHAYGNHKAFVRTGGGVEVNGVYHLSSRSGLQVQAGVSSFRNRYFNEQWSIFTLKAGYRYQFGSSGFYAHGLVGPEFDLSIGDPLLSFAVGGGKRFTIKDTRFIDAGVDYHVGNTEPRVNVKLAFGFTKRRQPRAARVPDLSAEGCF